MKNQSVWRVFRKKKHGRLIEYFRAYASLLVRVNAGYGNVTPSQRHAKNVDFMRKFDFAVFPDHMINVVIYLFLKRRFFRIVFHVGPAFCRNVTHDFMCTNGVVCSNEFLGVFAGVQN